MINNKHLLAATNGGCYILYSNDYVESSLYIYSTGFNQVVPAHTQNYRIDLIPNQTLTIINEAFGNYHIKTLKGKLNLEDGVHSPTLGVPQIEIIPYTSDTVATVEFIGN